MKLTIRHGEDSGAHQRAETAARALQSLGSDLAVSVLPDSEMAAIIGIDEESISSTLEELKGMRTKDDAILNVEPYTADVGFGIEVTLDSEKLRTPETEEATLKILYKALTRGPVLFKLTP